MIMSRWQKTFKSNCLVCDREFEHARAITKYCTENCKNKAYLRKKRGVPIDEKSSETARGVSPGCSRLPVIVKVFPEPKRDYLVSATEGNNKK